MWSLRRSATSIRRSRPHPRLLDGDYPYVYLEGMRLFRLKVEFQFFEIHRKRASTGRVGNTTYWVFQRSEYPYCLTLPDQPHFRILLSGFLLLLDVNIHLLPLGEGYRFLKCDQYLIIGYLVF